MSLEKGLIRVLVVDDSELFLSFARSVLTKEEGFELVAVARDGAEAAARVREKAPQVVTMDLKMPRADGFLGIARIMAETPTPILVLCANPERAAGFRALSLGALDLLEKPGATEDLLEFARLLRSELRLLAGVKVIRHPRGLRERLASPPRGSGPCELVVIGASLGGPRALSAVLKRLPSSFPLPVLVVQHIARGFTAGLAGWLDQEAELEVSEAKDLERLVPGRVLVAPSGRHLLVDKGAVRLSDAPPVGTFRPSVNPLFASAAGSYGGRVCGVLLTGMGEDGAEGLLAIKRAGGTSIVQDEASSVVFGMGRAAILLGAVDRVLPLEEIPGALMELLP